MNPAARCREEKEKYPERYCVEPRCLWRTSTRDGFKPCAKHSVAGLLPSHAAAEYACIEGPIPQSTGEARRLVWRKLRQYRLYLSLSVRRTDYLDPRRERFIVLVHGAVPAWLVDAIRVPGVLILYTERKAA